ncbi:MAG: hypothetical protein RMJ04_07250 [Geminicoccaceae bacterium]|nr:hypothetical protein [Geminicoccaceae bacterium]
MGEVDEAFLKGGRRAETAIRAQRNKNRNFGFRRRALAFIAVLGSPKIVDVFANALIDRFANEVFALSASTVPRREPLGVANSVLRNEAFLFFPSRAARGERPALSRNASRMLSERPFGSSSASRITVAERSFVHSGSVTNARNT